MTVVASAMGPVCLARWVDAAGSYAAAFYALATGVALLAVAAMVVPIPHGADDLVRRPGSAQRTRRVS